MALASPAEGQQGTLTGRITDAETGQPVDAAQLSVLGTGTGGLTDATGRYSISLPAGSYSLVVNVVGSLLMGVLYVWFLERMSLSPEWRGAVLVGLLGAFTTFSTFAIETFNLLEEGAYAKALINALVSVVACIAATALGVAGGRRL